jgi:hypothetical protein
MAAASNSPATFAATWRRMSHVRSLSGGGAADFGDVVDKTLGVDSELDVRAYRRLRQGLELQT